MFEFEKQTQSDILFQKSLRSHPNSSSIKRTFKSIAPSPTEDSIINTLRCIVFDLHHKKDSVGRAVNLICDASHPIKQHIMLQLFTPEAKTHFGEKLLKEPEIWILLLISFYSLYPQQNKYCQNLINNIKYAMSKRLTSHELVDIVNTEVKVIREFIESEFEESKQQAQLTQQQALLSSMVITQQQIQESQLKIQEQQDVLNISFEKISIREEQSQSKKVEPQSDIALEDLINEQVIELEQELKKEASKIQKLRKSFTERLYSMKKQNPWKSDTKSIESRQRRQFGSIKILDGLESREINTNQLIKIDHIIENNINENNLHAIAMLSISNPKELLLMGNIALIQTSDGDCTSTQYFEDFQYYCCQLSYKYDQNKKIYIPRDKYIL